jgi:lysozyme family protein
MNESFLTAFERLKGIEFSNDSDVLHKNSDESGLTFYGIYQSANKKLKMWDLIEEKLKALSIKEVSKWAITKNEIIDEVKTTYYNNYWKWLDDIKSQKVKEEMFFFFMNTGKKSKTILMVQYFLGVIKADGVLGKETIAYLNNLNDDDIKVFDKRFDELEKAYYKRLVRLNPKKKIYINGWFNRADII